MRMEAVGQTGQARCDDPHEALCAQLLKLAGDQARLADHWSVNWSSLHFIGHRHQIDLIYGGHQPMRAAAHLFYHLPGHLFDLGDHFVADVGFTRIAPEDGPGDAEGWRIGIELLTVKE